MLKQLTPERTSFEHCWIGPSTFQSFTVSTIGTLRSSWEVPGKLRCIRGSPKPGNDTESARNGGKGRSIFFKQVEEFNYPTILCNNNMSTYVIFCTCLLFFEFVSQRDTTTKPQCNRVGWRCLYHVLYILLPLHWILCFWCSNHADAWSKWLMTICGQVIQIARAAICQREFLCQIEKHVLRIVSQLEKYEQVWRHIRNLDKCWSRTPRRLQSQRLATWPEVRSQKDLPAPFKSGSILEVLQSMVSSDASDVMWC